MKIVGIAGSPHRDGMTAKLLDRALTGARAEGAETEVLRLVDEELEPCLGCGGGCWDSLECISDEAASGRAARLQDADGIIMSVPVYLWQLNGLTSLFIDKMRWDTRSIIQPRNARAAFGITCAGGSGTGCVLALQALYRYFYNQAFHGIEPLPVTRFNLRAALDLAEEGGRRLVGLIRQGIEPFPHMGAAMLHYEDLRYMDYQPLDELRLIVGQMQAALGQEDGADPQVTRLFDQAQHAEELLLADERLAAAEALSAAYHAGREAWQRLRA